MALQVSIHLTVGVPEQELYTGFMIQGQMLKQCCGNGNW